MGPLQFGELAAFRGVVGKFIVGEDSPGNDVRSHRNLNDWMRVAGRRLNGRRQGREIRAGRTSVGSVTRKVIERIALSTSHG
jgi:hypothetical protein